LPRKPVVEISLLIKRKLLYHRRIYSSTGYPRNVKKVHKKSLAASDVHPLADITYNLRVHKKIARELISNEILLIITKETMLNSSGSVHP
jgi:hypothetical protein